MSCFDVLLRNLHTTAPVTSLLLSAVNEIISYYGLIGVENPAISACVEAIADAVTHARFVGTVESVHGVALGIIQVLQLLVLSPPEDHLFDERISEIKLRSFRMFVDSSFW
ncbi:hypothetical protein QAD02_013199 [Eretmocerus hayati]|uniref:Uncharacterized protein n=1 Tax=Eretmocerus hayati TaxID=131215 RepID=A0ACC2P4Q3_9HYME|nr:hypothetical protein QAD02_013199 [Eretmocerus hayati]